MNHNKKKSDPIDEEKEDALKDEVVKLSTDRSNKDSMKKLVQIMPDDYYAWHLLAECRDEDLLVVNTCAIRTNPKSYPAWHHRYRLLQKRLETCESADELIADEDRLTRILLNYDPRNFHAWSYRRKLGLDPIRDIFNYSCLSDIVARGQPIKAKPVIYTDPFYEGGHSLFMLETEGRFNAKIFKDHIALNFPEPFMGRVGIGERVVETTHPVLFIRFSGTWDKVPKVTINEKVFVARPVERDTRFVDELLQMDPDCVFLNLLKLRMTVENRNELIDKLCRLDAPRKAWYKSLENQGYSVFVLKEEG